MRFLLVHCSSTLRFRWWLDFAFLSFKIEELFQNGLCDRCTGRATVPAVFDEGADSNARMICRCVTGKPGVGFASGRRCFCRTSFTSHFDVTKSGCAPSTTGDDRFQPGQDYIQVFFVNFYLLRPWWRDDSITNLYDK